MVKTNTLSSTQTLNQMTQAAVQLAQSLGFGQTVAAENKDQSIAAVPQKLKEVPAWLSKPCWQ